MRALPTKSRQVHVTIAETRFFRDNISWQKDNIFLKPLPACHGRSGYLYVYMAEHGKIAWIEYEFEDEFLYKNIHTIINKFSLSSIRSAVENSKRWDKWQFHCIFSKSWKYVRDIWDSNAGLSLREKSARCIYTCTRDVQVTKLCVEILDHWLGDGNAVTTRANVSYTHSTIGFILYVYTSGWRRMRVRTPFSCLRIYAFLSKFPMLLQPTYAYDVCPCTR